MGTDVGVLVGVLVGAWVGWVGWVDLSFLNGIAVGTDVGVLVGVLVGAWVGWVDVGFLDGIPMGTGGIPLGGDAVQRSPRSPTPRRRRLEDGQEGWRS
jgi:hypothetical protein